MKGTKFLLSFWLATGAFCLLQIFFGPGGLTEMSRLREQKARLEVRLEALKEENQRLTARYESLRTSAEAVELEARALGYFRLGEVPVRTLDGAEFRLPSETPDLSLIPGLPEERTDLTWFFRLAWPLLFLSFYAFFHLMGTLWPSKDRWQEFWNAGRDNLPAPLQTGLDFFRK